MSTKIGILEELAMHARLAELDRKIAACTRWGARLSVLHEEREALKRNLKGLQHVYADS